MYWVTVVGNQKSAGNDMTSGIGGELVLTVKGRFPGHSVPQSHIRIREESRCQLFRLPHLSYSLNSMKGIRYGTILGVIKGETRNLD